MSSFDENGDFNSVFVDSMMESDEEGRQNSAAKKASLDKNTGNRKRKSKWWSHFSVDEEDPTFASCKYCQKLIGCKTKNGTTPLANHISRCKKYPPNLDKKQKLIDFESETLVNEDGSTEIVSVPKCWKFDHDLCRKKLAKMLIVDELPFAFVEREGFIEFCKALNPLFKLHSRTTATRDCYALFIEQRNELKNTFKNLYSRVCLTTDTWTSGQNLSYMCLTAHFIDDEWNLHKRIINFCPIAGHSGQLIGRAVEKCLIEWGLKNIMTITVDNASSNDLAIEYLRRRLTIWESSLLEGRYLHMRCASHILNLIMKEGLKELDFSIMKVRTLVRYVRSSPARLQKFKTCIEEEKEDSKSLVTLDVETRWNSTFLMLESAIKFKKAFASLYMKDSYCFKELRKVGGGPIEDDWKRVSSFLPFLSIFYDVTLRLSGSRYVTCNHYAHEIYGTRLMISNISDDDEGIKKMAAQMMSKYDKYYGNIDNINIMMFVGVILDPRHKLNYVNWIVHDSYDETQATLLFLKIKMVLQSLFDSYASSMPPSKTSDMSSPTSTSYLISLKVGLNVG
ncbi:hypothetical protein F3Y22_tig00110904pilonHSYRG00114 [Hibiscus syriacus]|uniref:BED-type domain-containing protein n=1 Tax=Hibiscus syriacus TaxID=106335 RepID=A0A6A2ZEY4_HIBSY|nr:hypothetical protein F3Y22_tig00110904pilonHSYRG00114 [Hibiscus syriacus]